MKKTVLATVLFILFSISTMYAKVGINVGVRGGLSGASFWGSDYEELSSGMDSTTRNYGAIVGGLFELEINRNFSVHAELGYIQRGAKHHYSLSDIIYTESDEVVTNEITLSHLEWAILPQLRPGNSKGFIPSLYAGPSVLILLNSTSEITIDDEVIADTSYTDGLNFLDMAVNIGFNGKVPFPIGYAYFDLRYSLGLSSLDGENSSYDQLLWFNRNFGLMAGIALQVKRPSYRDEAVASK